MDIFDLKFRTFNGKKYIGFKGRIPKTKIKMAHKKGMLVRNVKLRDGWYHFIHKKYRR